MSITNYMGLRNKRIAPPVWPLRSFISAIPDGVLNLITIKLSSLHLLLSQTVLDDVLKSMRQCMGSYGHPEDYYQST
ncbi:MAG: hypothetical protein N2376_01080 [Clostridia bacterium]|nr:hypothetical protein [Clostridia bacterium]